MTTLDDIPRSFTALALVPLLALATAVFDYARTDTLPNLLWVCNVSNVILLVGLAARHAVLVWMATLWIIVGTPMWIMDDLYQNTFTLHALFTHVGSALVGLIWMRRGPLPGSAWPKAVGLALVLLVPSRLLAPPDLNVNVAHRRYLDIPMVESHVAYLALNTLAFGLALLLVESAIRRFGLRKPLA